MISCPFLHKTKMLVREFGDLVSVPAQCGGGDACKGACKKISKVREEGDEHVATRQWFSDTMNIREIRPEDATKLIHLIKEVENHSAYMLMEPGERKTTPEEQRSQLAKWHQQTNSTIFVAEVTDNFVGYVIAAGSKAKRQRHSAYLVIGILPDYRGKGIGSVLFDKVIKWASEHHISRLELTTVTENKSGLALYKKNGFEIEGTKRSSLKIDGKLYDEYYMAKLL